MAAVLVTDGEQRAALAVVRSLGRAGHRVVVGSAREHSLAGASRFAAESVRTPDPLQSPREFVSAIAETVRRLGVGVVFPVTEAAHLALLFEPQALAPAILPTPSLEIFARAADKAAVLRLARTLGISTPHQTVVASPVGAAAGIQGEFPVVIKPARSVGSAGGRLEKLSVLHAASPAALAQVLASLPEAAFPVLVQERIVGPGAGAFFLRWNGRIVARFAHRRLREKPPSGGVSVFAESVAMDEELMRKGEALLARLEWAGLAMVEFKRDAKTGEPFLMEVNGRVWGSLQLALDAGVDFPKLLVQAATGAPLAAPPPWRIGARSRWFWGDLDHLLLRLLRSPERLSLPPDAASRARVLLDFLDWRPWRDGESVFRLDDPRPFFRESVDWFRAL